MDRFAPLDIQITGGPLRPATSGDGGGPRSAGREERRVDCVEHRSRDAAHRRGAREANGREGRTARARLRPTTRPHPQRIDDAAPAYPGHVRVRGGGARPRGDREPYHPRHVPLLPRGAPLGRCIHRGARLPAGARRLAEVGSAARDYTEPESAVLLATGGGRLVQPTPRGRPSGSWAMSRGRSRAS